MTLDKLGTILLPTVAVIGLIVLLAMKVIDQTAGLTLITAIVGIHGGGVLVNAGANAQAARADQPPPPGPAVAPAATEPAPTSIQAA